MAKEAKNSLPVVCFCSQTGEVSMITSGYRIGIGETLLQSIKSSENNPLKTPKISCVSP
jgi:hypothetical protein